MAKIAFGIIRRTTKKEKIVCKGEEKNVYEVS